MGVSIKFFINGNEITAKMSVGKEVFHWDMWMFKHRVTIVIGGMKTTFSYYDHSPNPVTGDVWDALDAIMGDASYADYPYGDFCASLGYDTFDKTARRVYNACYRSLRQLEGIGLTRDDMMNISNLCNTR